MVPSSTTFAVTTPPLPPRRLSVPVAALTIAGSDSGGGAGIQADLRVFAAHGLLGTSALTAITAQNTLGVRAWEAVPASLVAAQIDAVLSDLPVAAAKTGMLGTAAVVRAVVAALSPHPRLALVVDPVMVATSGHRLLEPEAEAALIEELLPRADVLTPNRLEAAVLSGLPVEAAPEDHAERIAAKAPRAWVVVKGGHRVASEAGPQVQDLVRAPDGELFRLVAPCVETRATHGTGCSFSAAIASRIALAGAGRSEGATMLDALEGARQWLAGALTHALPMGQGHGPIDHLFELSRSGTGTGA